MNLQSAERIVNAVLYEGYILYPYRPSSTKNRQRWSFGGLFPRAWTDGRDSDPCRMQAQCLVEGDRRTALDVRIRFLQPVARQVGELPEMPAALPPGPPDYRPVDRLQVDGRQYVTWQEAVERELRLPVTTIGALLDSASAEVPPQRPPEEPPQEPPETPPERPPEEPPGAPPEQPPEPPPEDPPGTPGWPPGQTPPDWSRAERFGFPAEQAIEPLRRVDGRIAGVLVRSRLPIAGTVAVSAETVTAGTFRLTVGIENRSDMAAAAMAADAVVGRERAQLQSMASTHIILGATGGRFVSLMDPPDALAGAVRACDNQGVWPVLVGAEGARDTLLCSPIILYDHPQVAPESPGDLYDGTEIDEILSLRIMTMTDDEKREMAATDERARAVLERTEALGREDMERLHGTFRSARPSAATPGLEVGAHVRLHPKKDGGDVMDIALDGKCAVVEAVERDFEDRVHVAVVLDDDPGREWGLERMPGHRFFFSLEEIELLPPDADSATDYGADRPGAGAADPESDRNAGAAGPGAPA